MLSARMKKPRRGQYQFIATCYHCNKAIINIDHWVNEVKLCSECYLNDNITHCFECPTCKTITAHTLSESIWRKAWECQICKTNSFLEIEEYSGAPKLYKEL